MNDYWKKPIGYTDVNQNCFTFLWKIDDLYKGTFINKCIESPTFFDTYHQCSWLVKLCYKDFISNDWPYRGRKYSKILLRLTLVNRHESIVNDTQYYCKISILDEKFTILYKKNSSWVFDSITKTEIDFIEPTQLFDVEKNLINNGKLIISCNVFTIQKRCYIKDSTIKYDRCEHQLKLCDNLKLFLKNKTLTDIKLITKEEKIEAHKVILASKSSVFLTKLKDGVKNKKETIFEIDDFSADVVQEMLFLMYSGNVKNIDRMAHDLLSIANKYSILDLKEICAQFFGNSLSLENVINIFQLSNLYECDTLKNKACNYIAYHKKEIIESTKYKELSKSNPSLINEMFHSILSNSQNTNTSDFFKQMGYTNSNSSSFSFLWKIKNLDDDVNSNMKIQSPTFLDCNHECEWYLDLILDTNVTLNLNSENKLKNVTNESNYICEFSIHNEKFEIKHKIRRICCFKTANVSNFEFIGKKELFDTDNNLIIDKTLVICCTIFEIQHQSYDSLEFDVKKYQLEASDNLELFLAKQILTDVTLIINEERIEAHKVILASQSPVFFAMFVDDMKEEKENVVDIVDFSADVIKEMLSFIYTGKISNNITEIAPDLLKCADKYLILCLKEICALYIGNTLTLENVVDALILADLHSCDLLLNKTIYFISTHKSIIETPNFKELSMMQPKLANKVLYEILMDPQQTV